LNPNDADIPGHYGIFLAWFGRNQESLAQLERAAQLDPFVLGLNLHWGRVFFFMRDYDRARNQFAKTLELHPGYPRTHEWLGDACEKKGMMSEAVTQWTAALNLSGETEHAKILEKLMQPRVLRRQYARWPKNNCKNYRRKPREVSMFPLIPI
jgi:Tfp pilus assembly protein PilF